MGILSSEDSFLPTHTHTFWPRSVHRKQSVLSMSHTLVYVRRQKHMIVSEQIGKQIPVCPKHTDLRTDCFSSCLPDNRTWLEGEQKINFSSWVVGFQPLNHKKHKCKMFPSNNHENPRDGSRLPEAPASPRPVPHSALPTCWSRGALLELCLGCRAAKGKKPKDILGVSLKEKGQKGTQTPQRCWRKGRQ